MDISISDYLGHVLDVAFTLLYRYEIEVSLDLDL